MVISNSKTRLTSDGSQFLMEDFGGLYNEVPLSSLKWIFPKQSTMIQAQNFYLISDEGDFMFFQIAQTYLSVSSLVQATCRYFSKKNQLNIFQTQNFRFSDWSLSKQKDAKSTDFITSSVGPLSVEFLEEPIVGFNISYVAPDLKLLVRLESICSSLTLRDGIVEFRSSKISGSCSFKFSPQFLFTGSIEVTGMPKKSLSGMASLNLVTQLIEPYLATSKWAFFYFVADGDKKVTLSLLHFVTTMLFHEKALSQGILSIDGHVIGLTLNTTITFAKQILREQSGGYPLPTNIYLALEGIGPKGSSDVWKLEVNVPLETCVDEMDLLQHLPYLIRKIIQTLVSKPYCFQWLDDVEVILTRSGHRHSYMGKLFSEIIYV